MLNTQIFTKMLKKAIIPWGLVSASKGFLSAVTNLLIYPLYKEVTSENLLLSKNSD